MDIEVTKQRAGEFDELMEVLFTAFAQPAKKEHVDAIRLIHEEDRMFLAREDGKIVGVGGNLSFEMRVPGGSLPMAGVTAIGVLPTHRRRGVLTSLMGRLFEDIREHGEPLAALYASEAGIYGRFGFGVGSMMSVLQIERPYAAFRDPSEPRRIRLITKDEARTAFAPVYEAATERRPGMIPRNDAWWEYTLRDIDHDEDGFGPPHYVVAEGPDGADAYAMYRTKMDSEDANAAGTLRVSELVSTSPGGYAATWRYLLDIDLISKVEAGIRPADEPLPHLLADPRRLRFELRDLLWVRLVDVAPALAGRSYSEEGRLVIGVRDGQVEWNEERFELVGGPDGSECHPTDATPELTMSVGDLGAIYLGGTRLSTLAETGRIDELTAGAVERADRMFAWTPAPWTVQDF